MKKLCNVTATYFFLFLVNKQRINLKKFTEAMILKSAVLINNQIANNTCKEKNVHKLPNYLFFCNNRINYKLIFQEQNIR